MPIVEHYTSPNPFNPPEPHFKPGYTGWLPQYGPHRLFVPPLRYEIATNALMVPHPVAGDRLGYILALPTEEYVRRQREDYYVRLHERTAGDLKRRADTVSGYKGHIPRSVDIIGTNYVKSVKRATADFEKILATRQ